MRNAFLAFAANFEKEVEDSDKATARDPSELGLNSGSDLLRRFRDLEVQNLNALLELESLGSVTTDMIAKIHEAEARVNSEMEEFYYRTQTLQVLNSPKHSHDCILKENQTPNPDILRCLNQLSKNV